MKPLDALTEKHPLLTGAVGTISGFAGWVLENIEQVNQIVSLLGGTVGLVIGCITLASHVRRWRDRGGKR